MGIISTLTKSPGLLALGALGIGLFIFRDRISGFFSDITGGLEGAKELGETTKLLNENLLSNLRGIQDILSGDIFKDFKFPEFKFPEFNFEFPTFEIPSFEFPDFAKQFADFFAEIGGVNGQGMPTEPGDFTQVGMAEARARQEPKVVTQDVKSVFDITNPQGLTGDIATAIIPETQAEFQERAAGTAETFPEIFRSTSLTDEKVFGVQLSRNSEDFDKALAAEANRSEAIFAKLFGNVQNPNF